MIFRTPDRLRFLNEIWRWSLAFILLLPISASAQIFIDKQISPTEILVRTTEGEKIIPGDRLPIFSKGTSSVVGFAEALDVSRQSSLKSNQYLCKIIYHSSGRMIRVGDTLEPVDFTKQSDSVPGNGEALLSGKRTYSSRYKPLVSQGLIGDTAATLDRHEHMISILGHYSFGITDDFSISSVPLSVIILPYLGAKYRAYNNDWMALSVESTAMFHYSNWPISGRSFGIGYGTVSAYYDIKSNSKLISHSALTLSGSFNNYGGSTDSPTSAFEAQSSFRTGYEYILDNWDRFIFGPRANLEKKAVGGYLGYIFIWDSYHLSLNLNIDQVTHFKLGLDGYIPYVYMFWRF